MNRKSLAIIILVISSILYVMTGILSAEEVVVAVQKQPVSVCGPMPAPGNVITGNGYITYEAKNVDALYEQLKNIIAQYQGMVKNFNINSSPDMKYKNMNLEVSMDIEDAPSFMNDISGFKTVKNQSYNQYAQSGDNVETLKQELAVYNDRLGKAISSAKPDVEVIKLLVNKITETENKIKSVEMNQPLANKARINITIQQKGYPNSRNGVPLIITVIIAGMVIAFFSLGLFSMKLITWTRKKKTGGQI
jgi:hypothetical protein